MRLYVGIYRVPPWLAFQNPSAPSCVAVWYCKRCYASMTASDICRAFNCLRTLLDGPLPTLSCRFCQSVSITTCQQLNVLCRLDRQHRYQILINAAGIWRVFLMHLLDSVFDEASRNQSVQWDYIHRAEVAIQALTITSTSFGGFCFCRLYHQKRSGPVTFEFHGIFGMLQWMREAKKYITRIGI